ncbi:M23 family metallopeptidase [Gulosibacter chungangensis]|nr:M23 family metallopeptidase [Gulosibacter chungangensis]
MKRAVLAIYRVRGPLYFLAAGILIGNALFGRFLTLETVATYRNALVWAAMALAALCVVLTYSGPRVLPQVLSRSVRVPVMGRWQALNSPASAVPSHGVRAYGQAYAIDLVYDDVHAPRPEFGRAMMREPNEYPAFGQPVYSMIEGTVVRASGWRRDHRARSNAWGVAYMMIEGAFRELGGPGCVVGNHVVIRGDEGVYAVVAHLKQGSLAVSVGDRIAAGVLVGYCGNSGNSSEPHVHAQLMDRASFWTGQGVPMVFENVTVGDESAATVLPANGEYLATQSDGGAFGAAIGLGDTM